MISLMAISAAGRRSLYETRQRDDGGQLRQKE